MTIGAGVHAPAPYLKKGENMAFERSTDADLQGKGVLGQPVNPGLSATDMQKSVEQIPREVICLLYTSDAADD